MHAGTHALSFVGTAIQSDTASDQLARNSSPLHACMHGQDFAEVEGNLHRALASRLLANYARRKTARHGAR